MSKPGTPSTFRTHPWLRPRPALGSGIGTRPTVTSVNPSASRLAGGDSVTITGTNFRNSSGGVPPVVTFGGVPATSVVVVSSTSITCLSPAGVEAGLVDVTVTCGSESGTLFGGFLYYDGTLLSVTPNYAPVAPGTQPLVLIKGHSFVAGSTFTFGGLPATDVTFIDDTQYSVRIPEASDSGYVDVVMTSGSVTNTLRSGFHYTFLARGTDIRRVPGVNIQKQLGSQANQCKFSIDGRSNQPVVGERVLIVDEEDGDRVLFRGYLVNSELTYEGQPSQLVWSCTAIDLRYFLNKYRPFGTYINVSVSEVVLDLMGKYAPDFSTAAVQTNLALVTISFDGTNTMTECLDKLAQAIGGGRWYPDDDWVLHFFHPRINQDFVLPVTTGPVGNFTAATISVGSSIGSLVPFQTGYYGIRVAFIYSNGAVSRLGPISNIVGFDGTKFIHIDNLPIGANPSGSITCVGRQIFYLRGSDELASGWTISDNSTTSADVYPAMQDTATVNDNSGDPVTVQDSGSSGGTSDAPPAPPVGGISNGGAIPLGSGHRIYLGGRITSAGDVSGGFHIDVGLPLGSYFWKISAIYANGQESGASERSPSMFSDRDQGVTFGQLDTGFNPTWTYSDDGKTYSSRGYDAWLAGVPVFPVINGVRPIKFRLYANYTPLPTGAGGATGSSLIGPSGTETFLDSGRTYVSVGDFPYFVIDQATGKPADPITPTTLLDTSIIIPTTLDFGSQPKVDPSIDEPTLTWPNPDGPYLEDGWFTAPHDIDDDDDDLLHEDTGSQKFTPIEDTTQLRNRVKVFGSGSVSVADAVPGDVTIAIADPTKYSVAGGTLLSSNGVSLEFFSVSSLIAGSANLLLTQPLTAVIPAGSSLVYYCMVEDVQSQRDRGAIELDKNGDPSDGIHEYVINDPSLNSVQQVYLRAHAEIDVYSKPIITLYYATRDPYTRPGAIVHVDMSNPPCHGDFLIQSVTIDQIHDESDQLNPRYTVVACSSLFDLTGFILTVAQGSSVTGGGHDGQSSIAAGGTGSVVGVGAAATAAAVAATATPSLGGAKTGKAVVVNQGDLGVNTGSMISEGGVTFSIASIGTFRTPKFADGLLWVPASVQTTGGANNMMNSSSIQYFSSLNQRPMTAWRVRTPTVSEIRFGSGAAAQGPAVEAWVGWTRTNSLVGSPARAGVFIGLGSTTVYDGVTVVGGTHFQNLYWWAVYLDANQVIQFKTKICPVGQDTIYDLEMVALSDSDVQCSVTPFGGSKFSVVAVGTDLAGTSVSQAGWVSTNVNATQAMMWCNQVIWSSN